MGIYIKDMGMPTRCGRCDMCITEAGGDTDAHKECCITGAIIDNLGEKMEDCPLVSIPPHGRCIDADALTISTAVPLDGKPYQYVHIDNIDDAPTIIPAEEASDVRSRL